MSDRSFTIAMTLAAVLLAACFGPEVSEGLACGPNQSCPAGQTCDNGTCRSEIEIDSSTPDAPVGAIDAPAAADARPDGRPDATPVECTGDQDCQTPPDSCSLAGTCDLDTNTCSFPAVDCSGENSACTMGVCDPSDGNCIAQPINEDSACGAETSCGNFGACEADSGTCPTTGTRSRTCNDFTCQSGTCTMGAAYTDTESCAFDSTGDSCGNMTVTDCAPCEYGSKCAESGSRSCTCTEFTCAGGSCESIQTSCQQPCSRSTDGDSCGSETTCGNYGPCTYSSDCDNSGSKSRTCNDFTCSSGTCTEGPNYTDTATCTRITTNDPCGSEKVCGTPSGECQYSSLCDETGTKERTCNNYTCSSSQTCVKGPSYTETVVWDPCDRDTEGNTCQLTDNSCPLGKFRPLCCSSTGSCSVNCGACM